MADSTCIGCGRALETERCGFCGVASRPGGFVTEALVVQGPFGRMHRARGPDGAAVAVKELTFAAVPDAARVEAFEREGAFLQQLSHPSIPRFVAAFREGEGVGLRLYLASAWIEGESLASRLARGPLREPDLIDLARQLLGVLQHLHGRTPALLHRDVKPANVLLQPDGRWVLVDFGSARQLSGERTFGSSLVGTFGYAPPEQLGGTVDATSDLYALGATLLHAATGSAPSELLAPDLSLKVPPTVPLQLRSLLVGLLARRPEDRFPSATHALAALDAPAVVPVHRVAPEPPVRSGFVVALAVGLVLAAGAEIATLRMATAPVEAPVVRVAAVHPAGPSSPGGSARDWFQRARPACNAIEVSDWMARNPPPEGWEGEGYAAGCWVLAGKVTAARERLMRAQPADRYRAAGIVFDIAHPIADRGDDVSAGPVMDLVVEFWPNHFQALYHAGMSDHALGRNATAKPKLERFMELYTSEDGFRANARAALARIERGEPSPPSPGAH